MGPHTLPTSELLLGRGYISILNTNYGHMGGAYSSSARMTMQNRSMEY